MSDILLNPETVFAQAIEIESPEARAAFLDRACRDDAELRREVEMLVVDYFRAGKFLENPAAHIVATVDDPITERPGTVIGPYKLLQQIGEGGMGTVFMAEQTQPVQRKVALKVIKPGMDSRQVIARFEAERQALAVMDHVNIARVLDAGTTEAGLPYFVMELVHGVPITKYCDDNRLTPRERLELFVPVCQAIQHAHQKGIIHRDIKPSNVMITLYDGKPVPKVIDFGVAKATEQRLTERTLFTQYGTMVGTFEYMSPEQAEMSALGVDTRSDIFSLGVLLYELLTGSTPLSHKRVREAAHGEVLRMIREEEAPKPSTRLSDSGEALASISAQRHMEPAKLTKLMRGELDWIVMKCLEKDRNRRYETASAFAADVQRYLNDEAVQACPPSALYRIRKIARRNKGLLITVGLVLTALIVGTAVSIGQAIRATHAEGLAQQRLEAEKEARTEATANFQKARQAVDEYFTLVSQSTLFDVPGLQPLRKQLLDAARKYYENFAQQRSADPAVRVELAAVYLRLAYLFQMMGEPEQDYVQAFDKGIALVEELLQDYPADNDLYLPLAGFYTGGRILHPWTEPPVTNLPRLERGAEIWEQFTRAHPMNRRFRQDLAIFYSNIRAVASKLGKPADGLRAMDKAYALSLQNFTEDPASPEYREILAGLLLQRGWDFYSRGRFREAAEASREAIPLQEKLAAENHVHQAFLADLHRWTGMFLANAGQKDEGLKTAQRALELHRQVAAEYASVPFVRLTLAETYLLVGNLLQGAGRHTEAEDAYQQGLAVVVKLAAEFPQRHEYGERRTEILIGLVQTLRDNGNAHAALGEWNKAVADYAKAIELNPAACAGLTEQLKTKGRLQEAEKLIRQAVVHSEKRAAAQPQQLAFKQELTKCYLELIALLKEAGKYKEAEQSRQDVLAIWQQLVDNHPAVPEYRRELAFTHRELALALRRDPKRIKDAEDHHRQSLVILEKLAAEFPGDSQYLEQVAHCQRYLGFLLSNTLRFGDAERAFTAAVKIFEKLMGELPNVASHRQFLANTLQSLGNVQAADGRPGDAEKSFRQAIAVDPKNAAAHNNLSWLLATGVDPKFRDAKRAVELGKKAVELEPKQGMWWNTLGAAHYCAGNWKDSIAALQKSMELRAGGDSFDWFFVATACRQQGKKELAGKWFDQAVQWMEKNNPKNKELLRFRAEAAALLGRSEKASPESSPAQDGKLEIYSLMIETDSAAAWAYVARGELYGGLKEWDKAGADYAKSFALGGEPSYPLLLLRLRARELTEYRRLCAVLLERKRYTENPDEAVSVGVCCKLGPNAVADLTVPLKLVAKAVARQPKNRLYLGIQAQLLYRNGQFEMAAERLEQLIQTDEPKSVHHPFNKIILAMAYQSLGRPDEAKKCLGEATDWIEKNGQDNLKKGAVLTEPLHWHMRLELQVLRREAQELLNKESGASDHESGKK